MPKKPLIAFQIFAQKPTAAQFYRHPPSPGIGFFRDFHGGLYLDIERGFIHAQLIKVVRVVDGYVNLGRSLAKRLYIHLVPVK
jgi:hypothetical protein